MKDSLSTSVILLMLMLATAPPLNSVIKGQERSREELLKEAGRLITEAERAKGEALKKIQPGADRKLRLEAERAVAESFLKAIELWREAGHDQRLFAGIEELTRIYFVLGDYEQVVQRLTQEADFWQRRGDYSKQIQTLFSLGIRQSQMKREAAAVATLQRVVEMSRSERLHSLGANALSQLAALYDKAGRADDAASSRERAKELWAIKDPNPAPPRNPPPPATVPAQWIDLPGAPLAAEYRVVDSLNQAVLVNRSSKGVEMILVGCVTLDENSKTRVGHTLMGVGLNHGGIRPGSYYQPFSLLNGPRSFWTDEKMGCEGADKMTVIQALFDDGTKWKADGTAWVVRSN